MSAPVVSVVITTWNRVDLLRETLESVLRQTFDRFEVIVVDNESTDTTAEYVTGLADPRVRYLRNANGGVVAVNRNLGVAASVGDWVAFCDDDDLWTPQKLERQITEAERFPTASVIASDAVYFSLDPETNAETTYGSLAARSGDGWVTFEELVSRQRTQVVLSSAMVRRDAFRTVGEWDTDPEVFAIEDLQFWIRLIASGLRIRYIDDMLVRYRMHPAAASAPDSRVTARKCLRMIDGLRDRGVLSGETYRVARKGFERRSRIASLKEIAKRVPGLKSCVYRSRAGSRPKGHR